MSSEVAIRQISIADLDVIAEKAAKSRLFGLEKDQIFTLCLLAESEGLHPIAALRRFHVIEGKPSMRADAMQSEFQRSGGRVDWIRSDAECCEAVFTHREYAPKGFPVKVTRKEMDEVGISLTFYDKKTGKYFEGGKTKDIWKKFPRQMLRARAISEGVRAVNPSICVGVYTPEEVADFDSPRQVKATVDPPPPFAELAHEAQKVVDIQARNPEPYVESFPEKSPEACTYCGNKVSKGDASAFHDGFLYHKGCLEQRLSQHPEKQPTLIPPAPTSRQQMDEGRSHDPQGWAQAEADRQTEKQRPPRSDVERLLKEMTRAANDHWMNWLKLEGVAEIKPLLTVFQLENHLGTTLIEEKVIGESSIEKDGKRNRIKQLQVLEKCQAKNREKFDAMCSEYFAKLMGDGAAALGILAPFDDRQDEPAEVEESDPATH